MNKHLVYDLPTRLFHWLFSGLFISAFVIAKSIDDESLLFCYHSLLGLVAGFLVILRIAWGFVGSRNARFSNFALKPVDLLRYFKGVLSGDKKTWPGHNPATSWAALLMMGMTLGLCASGYFMSAAKKTDFLEEMHEVFGNILILTAGIHILGIALHTFRHKEMIGLHMLNGKKSDVPEMAHISNSHSTVALLFVAIVAAFSMQIFNHFDPATRSLEFFGRTLQIGESATSPRVKTYEPRIKINREEESISAEEESSGPSVESKED